MPKGYVISDLHLYASRSSADEYLHRLHEVSMEGDFLVFNGDIFDFRWTTLPNIEQTIHAAIAWLEDIAQCAPNCRFIYVMGNHDGLAIFAEHLNELASRCVNFEWHESHVHIDDKLFLHGDLPISRNSISPVERRFKVGQRRMPTVLDKAYALLLKTHAHRAFTMIHKPPSVAKKVYEELNSHDEKLLEGMRHVYFGHIHRPFFDCDYKGVSFHNTGAAIQGLECHVLATYE